MYVHILGSGRCEEWRRRVKGGAGSVLSSAAENTGLL